MLVTSAPALIPLAFAADAISGTIRAIPTTTSDPTAASLTLGFPIATFTPIPLGGTPPNGEDINGILNWLSAICQWEQAGGVAVYNAAFQTAIGGYPNNAVLLAAAGTFLWISTADNNLTDPDTGGAGWEPLTPRWRAAARAGGSGAAWTIPVAAAAGATVPLYLNGVYFLSGVADANLQTLTLAGTAITASPALSATDVIYYGSYQY
jgi:hypothetical protein